MKQNFGRKIVLLIHWLMSLVLGGAMVALFFMNALPVKAHGVMVIAFAVTALIVYLIFALGALLCIFPGLNRWRRRNFVTITASGLGSTLISLSAVDQVINQAIRGTPGIADQKIDIINNDDNIEIDISLTVEDDAHIPTVTSTIQTAVRELVQSKCGVEVKNVVVSVHSIKEDEPEPAAKMDESSDEGAAEDTAVPNETADDGLNAAAECAEATPKTAEEEPVETEAEELEVESFGSGAEVPVTEDVLAEPESEAPGDEEWIAGLEDELPEFEEESAEAEAATKVVEEPDNDAAAEEPQGSEEAHTAENTNEPPAPGQGTSRSAKRRRRRKKKMMARMQAEKEAASAQSASAEDAQPGADDGDAVPEDVEEDYGIADTEPEEAMEDYSAADAESEEAEEEYSAADTGSEDAVGDFWGADTEPGEVEVNIAASETEPDDFEVEPDEIQPDYGDTAFDAESEAEDATAGDATVALTDADGEEFDAYADYSDELTGSDADDVADDGYAEGTAETAGYDATDVYVSEASEAEYGAGDADLSDTSDVDFTQEYGSQEEFPDTEYEDATLRLDDDETPAYYEDDDTRLIDDDDTTY